MYGQNGYFSGGNEKVMSSSLVKTMIRIMY